MEVDGAEETLLKRSGEHLLDGEPPAKRARLSSDAGVAHEPDAPIVIAEDEPSTFSIILHLSEQRRDLEPMVSWYPRPDAEQRKRPAEGSMKDPDEDEKEEEPNEDDEDDEDDEEGDEFQAKSGASDDVASAEQYEDDDDSYEGDDADPDDGPLEGTVIIQVQPMPGTKKEKWQNFRFAMHESLSSMDIQESWDYFSRLFSTAKFSRPDRNKTISAVVHAIDSSVSVQFLSVDESKETIFMIDTPVIMIESKKTVD